METPFRSWGASVPGAGTKFLTPDSEPGIKSRFISLPSGMLQFLRGAIYEAVLAQNWEQFGGMTPQECADIFLDVMEQLDVNPFLGTIFPSLGVKPDNALWCDGTLYQQADYPELMVGYPAHLKIDVRFQAPNMTNRFIMGADSVAQFAGANLRTLTVNNLPPHSHNGHTHLPIEAAGEVLTQLPGMPVPDPLSTVGGGQPFDNRPSFMTVRFYMIAR